MKSAGNRQGIIIMLAEISIYLTYSLIEHSGYVTAAASFAYQIFQLSLLLRIPPSVINIDLSSTYPVLKLSTWHFSGSV